jgi:hypothetical protein
MSYNSNITPGAPPLLWSDVQEAFRQVNENFDILVATVGGGSGLTPLNFETLDTSVSPTTDNLYKLGDITRKWRAVHTAEFTLSDSDNGVWLGNAQIKGLGFTVNLPANSTIGGDPLTGIGTSLLIDPEKTFFKTIEVDNDLSVVATEFGDTVNLLSGSGIAMAVSSGADSITVSNTGILSVAAGLGMSSTTASGVATITNSGVRSLQSVSALPAGRSTGAGINITGSVGDNLRITNTGILTVSAGIGITVSYVEASGEVSISNAAPAGNAFAVIQINNDVANRLIADGTADTFNINSGQGITLIKDTATDTMTITVDPVFDLKGSIFGDDSTKIVDAVENKVYGGIFATTLRTEEDTISLGLSAGEINQSQGAVAIGKEAGYDSQSSTAVAIGWSAGRVNQGTNAVAIGYTAADSDQGEAAIAIGSDAANTSQGDYAIAIGLLAGGISQGANSIVIGREAGNGGTNANSIILNATGLALTSGAAGFYVDPIRSTANGTPLMYNSTTKELFYSTVLEFVGSTISTNDSSGLIIDVQTTFNTDVTFENDLNVAQQLTVQGSRVINLAELKSVVAASASFADFQTRIAALV